MTSLTTQGSLIPSNVIIYQLVKTIPDDMRLVEARNRPGEKITDLVKKTFQFYELRYNISTDFHIPGKIICATFSEKSIFFWVPPNGSYFELFSGPFLGPLPPYDGIME